MAEILREVGIDTDGRGGRRRRPEPPDEQAAVPVTLDAFAGRRTGHAAPSAPDSRVQPAKAEVGEGAAELEAVAARGTLLPWLLFGAELLGAAVLGVVLWYVFSLLWDLYPYLAAVAAPIVLAGLVAGVQWSRQRRGRDPAGLAMIAVLLLVAALLVVVPAAAVLTRR